MTNPAKKNPTSMTSARLRFITRKLERQKCPWQGVRGAQAFGAKDRYCRDNRGAVLQGMSVSWSPAPTRGAVLLHVITVLPDSTKCTLIEFEALVKHRKVMWVQYKFRVHDIPPMPSNVDPHLIVRTSYDPKKNKITEKRHVHSFCQRGT